jgi:hypothetical protein
VRVTNGIPLGVSTFLTGSHCKLRPNTECEDADGKDKKAAGNGRRPYVIKEAREAVLKVLLNLTLSQTTVSSVVGHASIRNGMEWAGNDQRNLTANAVTLLENIKVGLQMVNGISVDSETEDAAAASTSYAVHGYGNETSPLLQKHVMISYCWEQQEVVLRIKQAMDARGCGARLSIQILFLCTVRGCYISVIIRPLCFQFNISTQHFKPTEEPCD